MLRNGNHTLHQKSWGGPSNFLGGGGSGPPSPPTPQWLRPCHLLLDDADDDDDANTTNAFKTRLDTFWHNQDIVYNFRSQLQGTRSRSQILYEEY